MQKSSRHRGWVPKGQGAEGGGEVRLPREAPGKRRAARGDAEGQAGSGNRSVTRAPRDPPL